MNDKITYVGKLYNKYPIYFDTHMEFGKVIVGRNQNNTYKFIISHFKTLKEFEKYAIKHKWINKRVTL